MHENNKILVDSLKWFVLVIKRNHEKQVAKILENHGFEIYCPLKKEIRQWSDRKKTVEVPIFQNYIFVRIKESNRDTVFLTSHIKKYLYWLGKPAIVRDVEIEVIRRWMTDDSVCNVTASHLQKGKLIKIEKGAFKDKEATIQEVRKNELKLVLNGLGIVLLAKIRDVA
ncbi:UpxY family transcription antiterminator [Maribacter sp. Asnod1-A12]|uniref:UpxY family transcription antiterminator n=1 Tax=Maribacter sp. Asnod1-A12 TaxID=3160576 RepID=UPI00386CAA79